VYIHLESTHFIFHKCSIYTHDGASAKFSTNSHETDYSVTDKTAYCLSPEAAIAAGQLVASGEEKAAWAKDRSSWAVPGEVGAAHAPSA
jgi:hypothetical protein